MSYVKTVWSENDPITVSKIQKIEDRAYEIAQEYKNVFNINAGESTTVGHIINMINNGTLVFVYFKKFIYVVGSYIKEDEEYTLPDLELWNLLLSDDIASALQINWESY